MKHALVVLAVLALALPAYAHDTVWTGTIDTDWFNAGNWDNGLPQTASGDTATVATGGTVDVLGAASGVGGWSGGTTLNNGSTVVIGAGADLSSNFFIGEGSAGTLIIKDGGLNKVNAYMYLYSSDGSNSRVELHDGSAIRDIGYVQIGVNAGTGTAELVQYGGSLYARSDYPVRIGVSGGNGTYTMHGGSLNVHQVRMGTYSSGGICTWDITSTDVDITISGSYGGSSKLELHGGYSHFIHAVEGAEGETVLMKMDDANFVNLFSGDDAQLDGFNNITMQYKGTTAYGGTENTHEASGADLGPVLAGLVNNYALEGLILGGDTGIGFLKLLDDTDNMGDGAGNDVLYVESLVIGAGSTLDVAGRKLYYLTSTIDGTVTDSVGGGGIYLIPEPATLSLLVLGGIALIRRRRA